MTSVCVFKVFLTTLIEDNSGKQLSSLAFSEICDVLDKSRFEPYNYENMDSDIVKTK